MTTTKIVKTSDQFAFTRNGESWLLSGVISPDWKDCLPTAQFLVLGASGTLYVYNIPDTRDEVPFMVEDGRSFSIGYDFNTFTVFLDVDEEAFLADEEKFFRIQQTKEENR